MALASIQSGSGEDHPVPVNPVRQCSNDRTILSVMKETFETVLIEVRRFLESFRTWLQLSYLQSNFISLNQKLESIKTKMTTCSETLEDNALVTIANQDAHIKMT